MLNFYRLPRYISGFSLSSGLLFWGSAVLACPATTPTTPTAAQCLNWMKTGAFFHPKARNCRQVVEARYIPSGSMLPTLQINDRLLVDKTAYCTQKPQRRDLILFSPPPNLKQQLRSNSNDPFLHRVIGLPGETVEIKQGKVWINGKSLQEPYIAEAPEYEWGPQKIPANQYFVLGDNRNNSFDSHYWGFVPLNLIRGQAVWRYFPFDRSGSLVSQ